MCIRDSLSAYSHPEVAAFAIYAASVDKNAHYTIKEIAAAAKVSEVKIFKLAKMIGCKLRLDPTDLVERIIANSSPVSFFSDVKAIKRKIEGFPLEKVQSLAPPTVVSAGIFLHAREEGKPLPLVLVAGRCCVHKRSLQSAFSALDGEEKKKKKRGTPYKLGRSG